MNTKFLESISKARLRRCPLPCVPPRRPSRKEAPRGAIFTRTVEWFLWALSHTAVAGASDLAFLRSIRVCSAKLLRVERPGRTKGPLLMRGLLILSALLVGFGAVLLPGAEPVASGGAISSAGLVLLDSADCTPLHGPDNSLLTLRDGGTVTVDRILFGVPRPEPGELESEAVLAAFYTPVAEPGGTIDLALPFAEILKAQTVRVALPAGLNAVGFAEEGEIRSQASASPRETSSALSGLPGDAVFFHHSETRGARTGCFLALWEPEVRSVDVISADPWAAQVHAVVGVSCAPSDENLATRVFESAESLNVTRPSERLLEVSCRIEQGYLPPTDAAQ